MKKLGIFLMVALLVAAGVMGAMAYTSASVTNDASVRVTDTSGALLALSKGQHSAAFYENDFLGNAKRLVIDLSKGLGNKSYGIQPNSTYTWDELFKVTNNSENTVDVKITMKAKDPISALARLWVRGGTESVQVDLSKPLGVPSEVLEFTLAPGASQWIDMETETMKSINKGTFRFDMIVEADAQ